MGKKIGSLNYDGDDFEKEVWKRIQEQRKPAEPKAKVGATITPGSGYKAEYVNPIANVGSHVVTTGTKALSTLADVGLDILEGGMGYLEGAVDWGTYRLADVSDFFGGTSLAEDLRKNADFDSTSTWFGHNQNVQENILGDWQSGIEEYSYAPDYVDNLFKGAGQIGLAAATSALTGFNPLATAAMTYTSSYGNARSEAKRNGATDKEANRVGMIHGIAETISENLFAGTAKLPVVGGWGSKITGKITGKITTATEKYFGSKAGKLAFKALDTLTESFGEGAEEIISNILVAVGNDIMHSIDNDFTYGMEGQSGNILEDLIDQATSKDSWEQFFSAALTSAIVAPAHGLINTKMQNKIINAWAKDNDMSFKDAKYILTGEQGGMLDQAKQEITDEGQKYNSNVELNEMAKERVLNYMNQTSTKAINQQIDYEEKQMGRQYTEEERQLRFDELKNRTEDEINSPDKYRSFELEKEPTDERDKALYESIKKSGVVNTEKAHNLYNLFSKLHETNKKARYEMTSNEDLVNRGILKKREVTENGKTRTEYGIYVTKNGKQQFVEATANGLNLGDRILINADGVNAMEATMWHEIAHSIKDSSPDGYNDLVKIVQEVYGKEDFENQKEVYRALYGDNENLQDEYINDKLGEMLNNEKFVNRMSQNRNLLERFIDKIKEMVQYVTSNKEQKQLLKLQKKLEDKYAELYKEADFNKGKETPSFSLDEDLEKYVYPQQVYENFKYEDKSKITQSVEELEEYKKTLDTDTDEGWSNNFTANAQIRALNAGYDNLYDYYVNQEKERLKADAERGIGIANRLIEEGKKNEAKNNQLQEDISKATTKQNEQFEIIQKTNPAPNDQLVWIRSPLDIKTFEQVVNEEDGFSWGDYSLEDAKKDLKRNKVRVYSSYAIKDGTFVSTSYQQALDYAGGDASKVHSREINPSNVAWISGDEGQYANTNRTRYSLSVADLNTGLDNNGNKLSQGQREYFKDSKATNEEGDLIQVYHTTTDDVIQFNEFNPVGTPYYKFGDQVVNFFTDSKEMSGSYADNYYEMADTKKLNTIEEAQIWLDSINSDLSIENNNIYGDNIEPEIKYENEEQLLKYLKSDVQRLIGEEARIQYQGYVNITNPYVIDAEGRYWNKVESKGDTEKTTRLINTPAEIKQELIDMANDSIHSFDETYFNWKQADNAVNYVARDRTNVTLEQRILNRMIHELEYQDVRDILDGKGSWGKKISFMDFLHHEDFITEQEYQEFKKTDKISQEILDRINNKLNAPLKYEDRYMANELEALGLPLEIKETTLNDLWRTREEAYKAYDENGRDESSQFVKKMMKAENELKYSRYGKIDDLFYVAKNDFTDDYIRQQYNDWSVTNDIVKKIIDLNNYGENYDGVIIKNVVDYGGRSDTQEAHDLYITFNSNQFKASDNLNPTQDQDIRYQLQQTPSQRGYGTYTEDITRNRPDRNLPTQETNLPTTQTLQTDDEELPFYEGNENLPQTFEDRMAQVRQKLADDRFTKMMDKQTYKSIKDSTKMAKSYLDFDSKQTEEFKKQITKLAKLPKDNLIKAKNYNRLKDIVRQYANKDVDFVNEELKSAQKDVRNTELIVSQELKNQITDWSDFRKSSGLKIRTGLKSNVDSIYQELLDTYPGMLDSTITNYADQLQELKEFVKRDNKFVQHFELSEDSINQITNKVWEKLSNNALTKQEIENIQNDIKAKLENRTREVVRQDLLDRMGLTESDIAQGKDITSIAYQRTDPNRLNEKVFGLEVGRKINEATAGFVKQQEANKIRFLNKERGEIKDLGIKARSKESAAVQKFGEKQYVNSKGELVQYTEQDLRNEFKNEATIEKIKNAADVLRQKYDRYIDMINTSLVEMGYDPIPKRQDYFKHFMELEDKLSQFGWTFSKENIMKEELPTDINGLTADFKPGKNYFASALQRKGLKTTYDAITGIDSYLEGASNLIYHTESIQRYRALSKLIRDTYGQQHGLENLELMTPEEAQQRVQDVYDNKLSRYAAWLDEQANSIAGKKAQIDRSVERFLGRKVYSFLNALKKQIGSNMTGYNIRSSLTNFASAIQGASKTQKLSALQGFAFALKNYRNLDPLVAKSDFLATRFGSDSLSKKTWQKISDSGQVFMNATDRFTSLQIWGGKYYEGLHHGLTEQAAIKQADDFAARIMGDRSLGQTAEIFNSKTLGFLTQFQLEVNNQWSSMIHDNKMALKQNPGLKAGLHVANQLGQLYIASWVFNNLMKAVTGSDVMFDPIDLLMDLFNPDDDKPLEEKATDMIGKIVNQLPMASIFTGGRIPISEAFKGGETFLKYATGQTDQYGNKYTLEDVGNNFIGSFAYYLLPTGYGQLRKTTQGLSMYANELPGSYTASGRLRFEADTSPLGILQAGLFGQYASGDAREYFDKGLQPLTEKKIEEAKEVNLPIKEYRKIDEGISKAKQDAKERGDSQTEAQYDYIYNLPLDMDTKNKLLNSRLNTSDNVVDDNGYVKYTDGSKNYWYDEENNIVYNNKYREMDNIDISQLEKYSNVKDLTDYGNYGSLDEFNYATKNPTKYALSQQIASYDDYVKYKDDIAAIKDNYNDGTDDGKKKAKKEVFDYINYLPLNKYQKLMLQKEAGGYSIKSYKQEMFDYINRLDLTKQEKQNIYEELF